MPLNAAFCRVLWKKARRGRLPRRRHLRLQFLAIAGGLCAPNYHRRCCCRNAASSKPRCIRAPCCRGLPPAAAFCPSACGTAPARRSAAAPDASLDWPAPRNPESAIDDVEHDLAILGRLLHSSPKAVTGRANYLFTLNSALGRSLRTRWARWRQKKWSAYDGICSQSEDMRAALSAYRLRSRSYSPTSLQHFAICTYRFLLAGIYRLAPHEVPCQIERLDPVIKGAIFHRVQAALWRELLQSDFLPLNQAKLESAGKLLDQIVGR